MWCSKFFAQCSFSLLSGSCLCLRSLVFELAPGGELFDPIADTKFWFEENVASRVMRQALEGLQYLHETRVVHRDLKPENILLQNKDYPNAQLKLIDFGLATKMSRDQGPLRKHVGTPYYIAPEVLNKKYSESCDVWSMGVILYTICVAYPPFWGNTEAEIYARIKKGMYRFHGDEWNKRSDDVKDLVRNLLHLNADERITVEGALNHPWIVYEGEPNLAISSPRIIQLLRRWSAFPWLKRLHVLIASLGWEAPDQGSRERSLWASLSGHADSQHITLNSLQESLDHISISAQRGSQVEPPVTATVMGSDLTGTAVDAQAAAGGNLADLVEAHGSRGPVWAVSPASEVARLLAAVDTGATGQVTFKEFRAWGCPRTVYLKAEAIVQSFKFLDADGDGFISADDLVAAAGSLQAELQQEVGAGRVNLEHFVFHIIKEATLMPNSVLSKGFVNRDPEWQEGVPAQFDGDTTQARLKEEAAAKKTAETKGASAAGVPGHGTSDEPTDVNGVPAAFFANGGGARSAPFPVKGGSKTAGSAPPDVLPTNGSRIDSTEYGSARRPPPSGSESVAEEPHDAPPGGGPAASREPSVASFGRKGSSKLPVHPAPHTDDSTAAAESKSAEPTPAAAPAPTASSKGGWRRTEGGGGGLKGGHSDKAAATTGTNMRRMATQAPRTIRWDLPEAGVPLSLPTTEAFPSDKDGMPLISLGDFMRIVTGNEGCAF